MTKRHNITIAPRLANGDSRVNDYGRLPYEIKEGLRNLARQERKSMSWMKEQVIIRYFKLHKPEYKTRTKRK